MHLNIPTIQALHGTSLVRIPLMQPPYDAAKNVPPHQTHHKFANDIRMLPAEALSLASQRNLKDHHHMMVPPSVTSSCKDLSLDSVVNQDSLQ